MDKKQAMAKINEHVGQELLNNRNTICSKINSAKDVWWFTVAPRKFRSDLHIALIKKGGSGLIWLRITADFISAPEKVFSKRQNNDRLDLEISSRGPQYMKDVRSDGTGYDFARHVKDEIG